MGGFSRERQEMVSGRVHNQLLQLSDERAERAERKIKELEQEVLGSLQLFLSIVYILLLMQSLCTSS